MAKKKETKNAASLMEPPTQEAPAIVDIKQYIQNKVLEDLGTPNNFSHINAVNTWENRWRVNVYSKEDGFIAKFKIVNSFFCIWENNQLVAKPLIEKIY